MKQNPVEDNFVTRLILGVAVIYAMMIAAVSVATAFRNVGIPRAELIGTALGAMLVFVIFALLYRCYDARFGPD